jgi:two-component system response regulator NreC
MKQISVFIVDDSQIHLEGLKIVFKQDPTIQIIGEAHNKAEVMKQMPELHPEIVLLDICLEKEYDGIEITKELTALYPETHVIILSHNKDRYSIINSIRSGARAYLAKDTSADELTQTIHTVLQGKGLFLGETIPRETLYECFGDSVTFSNAKPYHLSEREIEVIEYLSKGYSTKEIAEILYLNSATIESHKEHIREKLNLKTIIEIVVFAIKNKLILID